MSAITSINGSSKFSSFAIRMRASTAGSIGTKYGELRHYTIVAQTQDEACDHARMLAYREGLEHTLITNITETVL